jgi:hypothetical protein
VPGCSGHLIFRCSPHSSGRATVRIPESEVRLARSRAQPAMTPVATASSGQADCLGMSGAQSPVPTKHGCVRSTWSPKGPGHRPAAAPPRPPMHARLGGKRQARTPPGPGRPCPWSARRRGPGCAAGCATGPAAPGAAAAPAAGGPQADPGTVSGMGSSQLAHSLAPRGCPHRSPGSGRSPDHPER